MLPEPIAVVLAPFTLVPCPTAMPLVDAALVNGIAPKGVLSAAFAMPPSMATLFTPAALVN
jgi:hypothetical protein